MSYPFSRSSNPVGSGRLTGADIDKSFSAQAQGIGQEIIDACAELRLSDGRTINSDLAAGQVHHETGGGTSRIFLDKNNPGGIGAENDAPYEKAIKFDTRKDGVRAFVAGLLTYNDVNPLYPQLDPRYAIRKQRGYIGIVQREDKALYEYEQRYAWSKPEDYAAAPLLQRYGAKVAARTNLIVERAGKASLMEAQIAGFVWSPADPDHYKVGRSNNGVPTRIRGGAQHYTAGTNSLDWLRSTSEPEVSVHFLIAHDPTMDKRGHQIVKIEDTSWTTAFANPYTVAIEYEHKAGQNIPDIAYEVMAQTWYDITRYVRDHNLGDIEKIEGHKVWVNNPSLICPDGIDVERVERRWQELVSGAPSVDPNRLSCVTKNEHGEPFEIVNVMLDGRWINMLDAWYTQGGVNRNVDDSVRRCGWAQTGMYYEAGDGSYRQVFDNLMLEIHRDGSYRVGGLGMAYVAALKRIKELEGG